MPLWHKVGALALLWLTTGYAVLALSHPWWVKMLLLGIAAGVTIHLLSFKTLRTGPRGEQG